MLAIENLTYRIGPRLLFEGASATIHAGHRVGFVGRNGAGKTTLLKLILGELEAESGRIDMPARWRVGVTSQEAPSGPQSLLQTVLDADRELAALNAELGDCDDPLRQAEIYERLDAKQASAAPARAARILAGLGFDEAAQQRPCSDFSGGWRMRVALAGLLFTEPDLLLLDEPTNHLDLEATIWLEDYLRHYPGTIVIISHDRTLLNRAVSEILHLEGGKLSLYQGGYDRFEATRAARLELDEKARTKQEAKRAHLQSFVDRFRYKATKAKQAQSRIKMLERLQPIAEVREEGSIAFHFPESEALSPPLFQLDQASVGYDGRAVLKNIDLRLDEDDRIALLGANGHGKSTLIKLIAGRLSPMDGDVKGHSKLRIGYFGQHQAEELDMEATPIIELSRKRTKDTPQQLRTRLGGFGFSQQRAETLVKHLSGGEKARLLFALMSCEAPHLLLLDEPTNHLDIPSRQALVEAINAFSGAVVIVSHDPFMVEMTADHLWLVDQGQVKPYDGTLDDYRAFLLNKGREDRRSEKPEAVDTPRMDAKEQRRLAADRRARLAPLKKKVEESEARLAKLGKEKAVLEERLADPALYDKPADEAQKLRQMQAQIDKDMALEEEKWLIAQSAYEDAEASA